MTPHFYQGDLLNSYHDPYYSTDSSSTCSSSTSNSPSSYQPNSVTPFIHNHHAKRTTTRYHPYLKKHPTTRHPSPTILPHPAISPASSDSSHQEDQQQILSASALFGSLPSYNNNSNLGNNDDNDDDLGLIMDDDDIFNDFANMSRSNSIQSPPLSPSLFPEDDLAAMDDFILF